jgi:hypothetical protein
MGDTLRLELAPFKVKVLSVVTGAVKTQGHSYLQGWTLPANSLYKPIEDRVTQVARGVDGVSRTPLMDYSTGVVHAIIAGKTDKIWAGSTVSQIRFMNSWLPSWIMVSLQSHFPCGFLPSLPC